MLNKIVNSAVDHSTEESDDDICNLYNLFICQDYIEKKWIFNDLSQPLLCSNMSTTDHDLTGQIVWPACVLLSWFIYRNQHMFKDNVIIELGAGCGLASFVASHFIKHGYITDGNDIVIDLINKNKVHLQTKNITVVKLVWGIKIDIDNLFIDNQLLPDIVIGADVILWPNQIFSLLYTIRNLLLLKKVGTTSCYISYIVRASSTTDLLYITAKNLGLLINNIEINSFLPMDYHVLDHLQKHLLCITIDRSISISMKDVEIEESIEMKAHNDRSLISTLPC